MQAIISSLHYAWKDMDECFKRAKEEFLVDGVELSFHESLSHPHCTKEDIADIRKVNEQFGLSLCAHIWEDIAQLGPEKAAEALRHWANLSERVGVHGMVIHGGSYPDQEEGITRTRRTLEMVLPELEKTGIVLYLENHYAYDYKNCQELFSEVWEFERVLSLDSPSLRFCFDTGHAHLTGNSEDLLVNLQSYLSHVHIADNYGANDDHCLYKKGTVRWDSIWETLRNIEFDGTFCAEFPLRDNLAPLRQCLLDIENLKKCYSPAPFSTTNLH